MLIGTLASSISGVVDISMMGHYGAVELAAVSAGAVVFDLLSNTLLASVIGHQILAARFAGRDDSTGIRQSFQSSIWFSGSLAVVMTTMLLVGGGRLSGLISGASQEVQHVGAAYLAARAPSLLLLVPFALLAATFNAYSKPRLPMIGAIVISVANLLFDWLLIFGNAGFPRLGAVGNGIATTCSWVVGVGWLVFASQRFGLTELLGKKSSAVSRTFTTSIPKLAWPAIVSNVLDHASVAVFFAIIGSIGEAALGGGRIAFEVIVLLFIIGSSFSAAGRILIGRASGAARLDEVRTLWRATQWVLVIPSVAMGAALIVFPVAVARVFSSLGSVVDAAADAMTLVAISLPLMGWTLGGVSVLRALGRTKWDMYANLVAAVCIQLPIAWLLVDVGGLGLRGAYSGVVGYWLARAAISEVLARISIRMEARGQTDIVPEVSPARNLSNSRPILDGDHPDEGRATSDLD